MMDPFVDVWAAKTRLPKQLSLIFSASWPLRVNQHLSLTLMSRASAGYAVAMRASGLPRQWTPMEAKMINPTYPLAWQSMLVCSPTVVSLSSGGSMRHRGGTGQPRRVCLQLRFAVRGSRFAICGWHLAIRGLRSDVVSGRVLQLVKLITPDGLPKEKKKRRRMSDGNEPVVAVATQPLIAISISRQHCLARP